MQKMLELNSINSKPSTYLKCIYFFVAGNSENVQKKRISKKKNFGRVIKVWAKHVEKSKISKFSKFFSPIEPKFIPD